MDLAEYTREDLIVPLGEERYALKPRTLAELGELQGWFKRTIPSPLTLAIGSLDQCERVGTKVHPKVRDAVLHVASLHERQWPPRIGTRAWLAHVEDAEQIGHLILWGLEPRHPQMTRPKADVLAAQATDEQLAAFCCGLFTGTLPDPKARSNSTTSSTPTPTPTNQGPPPATTGTP
jgi:hypothetical protein